MHHFIEVHISSTKFDTKYHSFFKHNLPYEFILSLIDWTPWYLIGKTHINNSISNINDTQYNPTTEYNIQMNYFSRVFCHQVPLPQV